MDEYVPPLHIHKRLLDHVLHLKLLDRQSGELYLDRHWPELTGPDREFALSKCGQHIKPPKRAEPQDPFFCAAMYMAGVSLGDLAKLYGITKQTVHQKVCRRTNDTERKTMRDQPMMVDLEALELARNLFNEAITVNNHNYEGQKPLVVGRALLKAAHALIAQDRGTTELPDRPRRYSNMDISQPTPPVQEPANEPLDVPADVPTVLAPLTDPDAARRVEEANRKLDTAFDNLFGG